MDFNFTRQGAHYSVRTVCAPDDVAQVLVDELPDDLIEERAAARRRRIGFCGECHRSGVHAYGCPESDE